MDKLKPCPFCDDEFPYVYQFMTNFFEYRYAARCENCGAMSAPCKTPDEAKEKWNRRADNG